MGGLRRVVPRRTARGDRGAARPAPRRRRRHPLRLGHRWPRRRGRGRRGLRERTHRSGGRAVARCRPLPGRARSRPPARSRTARGCVGLSAAVAGSIGGGGDGGHVADGPRRPPGAVGELARILRPAGPCWCWSPRTGRSRSRTVPATGLCWRSSAGERCPSPARTSPPTRPRSWPGGRVRRGHRRATTVPVPAHGQGRRRALPRQPPSPRHRCASHPTGPHRHAMGGTRRDRCPAAAGDGTTRWSSCRRRRR